MDEHKLADAFRDAVGDVPPASFDTGDVLARSHRVTVRRRTQWAAGSALGVVALTGGLLFGTGALGGGGHSQPMAVPGPETMQTVKPNVQKSLGQRPPNGLPEGTPRQGGEPSGTAGSTTGKPRQGCGPVDRELAAALTAELPAIAHNVPVAADGPCPADARAVSVPAQDGSGTGVLTVVLVPAPNAERAGPATGPGVVVATHSGGTLTVSSRPESAGAAPYAGDLNRVAADLAAKF